MADLSEIPTDQLLAMAKAQQAGPMPAERDRVEVEPTHVEAVLEPHSDQGSIPCASIRPRRDVRSDVPFFLAGNTTP